MDRKLCEGLLKGRALTLLAGPPWEVEEHGGKCLVLETGRPGLEPWTGRSGAGILAAIKWGACENPWNARLFPAESTWVAGDAICPPPLLPAPRPCCASSPTWHPGLFAGQSCSTPPHFRDEETPFQQPAFMEHLLCARHCLKVWGL